MNDLATLVQRTVAGDTDAWRDLQVAIQPSLLAIIRRHRSLRGKGLAALPDDVAEVTASTLERLARNEFQNLKRFESHLAQQQPPGGEEVPWSQRFDDWLYGVVDFVIREHLRKRFGRAPKAAAPDAPKQPSKRDLQTHAGRLDDHDFDRSFLRTLGMTARLTAAAIFECVARDFSADEAAAIRMYYAEDRSFEEIATTLGLAQAKDAERLIRKLNARLRYRFVDAPSDPSP